MRLRQCDQLVGLVLASDRSFGILLFSLTNSALFILPLVAALKRFPATQALSNATGLTYAQILSPGIDVVLGRQFVRACTF